MIKVMIVDDERLARAELEHLLAQHTDQYQLQVCARAKNTDQAIQLLNRHDIDLMFLDIQMPGKTGMEMLEELTLAPPVIFTTAHDQYAIDAFEKNAIDYLLKPIEDSRLKQALDKFCSTYQATKRPDQHLQNASITDLVPQQAPVKNTLETHEKIFLKDGERCWFVPLNDIYYFYSIGNYCSVKLDRGEPIIRKTLQQLEQRLPASLFFRASRQHIINLQKIQDIEFNDSDTLTARLSNGQSIPMSRRQTKLFKVMRSL